MQYKKDALKLKESYNELSKSHDLLKKKYASEVD